MKDMPIEGQMAEAIITELGQNSMFKGLSEESLREISNNARMFQFDPGEIIATEGEPSDSFFMILSGEVIIKVIHPVQKETVEIARAKPFETLGEIGLITKRPRSATLVADNECILLKFDEVFFAYMFMHVPEFALLTCQVLSERLVRSSRNVLLPATETADLKPVREVVNLLPRSIIQRHRLIPLSVKGNILTLGCVDDPTPALMDLARNHLPGMNLRPIIIDLAVFEAGLHLAEIPSDTPPAQDAPITAGAPSGQALQLDALLRRMVAEGASDLHLSAGHKPFVRIDGEIHEVPDGHILSAKEVFELCEPIMPDRNIRQFKEENDTDFAHAIPGLSRFRINLFADNHGYGGVFRQIPDKILTVAQLGLPPIVSTMCEHPKGLILVTGPTGSGKSTTLAAMIDQLNKVRRDHIITMEDPIEFVHKSNHCLVNQREIGPHTKSFARALKAVLREDPDIVLVGEMRDLETVSLALETANTGHLVFGTLHTNTAISTVSRIIDMFTAEQQNQVRAVLADNLRGVIAQTLCKRIGGGRVAALEILVSDTGVASLIRDGKTHMIMSAMQTGKARGNKLLNEELARLVQAKIIKAEEAMNKAVDKPDLAKKLGIDLGTQQAPPATK